MKLAQIVNLVEISHAPQSLSGAIRTELTLRTPDGKVFTLGGEFPAQWQRELRALFVRGGGVGLPALILELTAEPRE